MLSYFDNFSKNLMIFFSASEACRKRRSDARSSHYKNYSTDKSIRVLRSSIGCIVSDGWRHSSFDLADNPFVSPPRGLFLLPVKILFTTSQYQEHTVIHATIAHSSAAVNFSPFFWCFFYLFLSHAISRACMRTLLITIGKISRPATTILKLYSCAKTRNRGWLGRSLWAKSNTFATSTIFFYRSSTKTNNNTLFTCFFFQQKYPRGFVSGVSVIHLLQKKKLKL